MAFSLSCLADEIKKWEQVNPNQINKMPI